MSFTTIPQSTLPENRLTPARGNLSGYVFRTAPYDADDPGPWLWRPAPEYRRDLRTGRHRRDEAPDPIVESTRARPRPRPRPQPSLARTDAFAGLREAAWARFLETSAVLALACTDPQAPQPRSGFRARLARWFRRVGRRAHGPALRHSPT